jgi:hypothetical protein
LSNNDILEITNFYKDMLIDSGIKSKQNGKDLEHILYMTESMASLEKEKALRWLGFIQGVLYCNGIYSIDELKIHSSKHNFISSKL